MSDVQWARASQFNWVFDAMGGCPLMEAVAGVWSGYTGVVAADGTVAVQTPMPGGGRVYYLRGVWLADTVFPWNGFWAEPESGDLTNYYTGGSYANSGTITTITLGTALAVGTEVQVYYIYLTGATSAKNDPLNTYPCLRPAWRGRADYTYDFAVDRVFDLMSVLHFAGVERGRDYQDIIDFLWEAYYPYAASRTSPLVLDTFERSLWDRGSYLLYHNSVDGAGGFNKFAIELYPGDDDSGETTEAQAAAGPRALRVVLPEYSHSGFAAWWGYGMNWSLAAAPFSDIDEVRFRLRGRATVSLVHHAIKINSTGTTGTAVMILSDEAKASSYVLIGLEITTGGAIGIAKFTKHVFNEAYEEIETVAGLTTGSSDDPVSLGYGLSAWWESTGGTDFLAGDWFGIYVGHVEQHPRRLQVILNDSAPSDLDPWGPEHTFIHAVPDRFEALTEFVVSTSQFRRIDNIIDDRDRRRANWTVWVNTSSEIDSYAFPSDREVTETIEGDTYYTQLKIETKLSATALAWGAWTALNTAEVDSTSYSDINYLIYARLADQSSVTIRTKLKDANGNYFYKDTSVTAQTWQRVTCNFVDFMPLVGGSLTHPVQVVDIGVASLPPQDATYYLVDVKFGSHINFAGASRLRLLEFKYQEQALKLNQAPAWWLDDVGVNLEAEDPYPYVPRLAISLGPYGQNAWRGPSLVHYAHPLAPYLINRLDLATTYVQFHRDAQIAYNDLYGGTIGPILPVHTRNDIENIALCGEESFNRFCWWPRYRDYGKSKGVWRFNGTLRDSEKGAELAMSSGSAVYSTGICQPGPTALSLSGSGQHAYYSPGTDFLLADQDFAVELVMKRNTTGAMALVGVWNQTGNQRSWLVYITGANRLAFSYSLEGINTLTLTSTITLTDTDWHHLVVTRLDGAITFYLDGEPSSTFSLPNAFFAANAPLRMGATQTSWPGYFNGHIDYVAVQVGRGMSAPEVSGRWQIIQGQKNGSAYPEVGHGLGQYWAFYRLAEYFFVSNDAGAWDILDNWLAWLSTYITADGSGWKFPVWFSEYGFAYGDYDPGAAASLAIGAIYIYMRNGDSRALVIAQKILEDLRLYRASGDYGGYLYKSDYHYSWMNALVAHAFGLAVTGRSGQAYDFADSPDDAAHFDAMMARFFALSGDTKPNVLNTDLIPFSYVENADVWDYAPNYLFMRQCGSTEGLVLMLHAALDYAKRSGSWVWFDKLLAYLFRESLAVLNAASLRRVSSSYDLTNIKNKISVFYGDYNRNNTLYQEVKDQALIEELGELPDEIDLQYGNPVITEDPVMAATLADRLLQRLSAPRETVMAEAWLEAARLDLNDTVAITSDFHGFDRTEFTLFGRQFNHASGKVNLVLSRRIDYPQFWAVDAGGTDYDSYAIDADTPADPNYSSRGSVQ